MLKLPYTLQSACSDGQRRTFAHITCGQCEAYQDHALTGVHNPEMVVKHMRRLGWTVDFGPARHNRCPACTASKRKRNTKVIPMSEKAAVPAPAAAMMPRHLTPDEKAQVRRLLDANFDDTKGLYLDGYSDRRIGEECKVPASSVAHLRELAYGSIRSDPEVEALRRDIEALQQRAATLSEDLGRVGKAAADLVLRVNAIEARRLSGKAA